MKRLLYFIQLFILISPLALSARSINETAVEILKNSPEFKSQNLDLTSIGYNLKTESNLPDPELGGEYLWMPSDVDNRYAIELTWGLEWPGVYRARSREAASKMTAAEKAVFAQRAERLAEIKDLLLSYVHCQQRISLLKQLAANNDSIYRLAEHASKNGEMTVLDLNKVKLEYANIRGAISLVEGEETEVKGNLSKLFGGDCNPLLSQMDCVFPQISLPTQEDLSRIGEISPSVQAAMADIQTAENARKTAKMEALPSISFGYKHAFEDGMHFNGALFGISIPIFSSRGKQKAAKAEIENTRYKAQAAAMEIESEAQTLLNRLIILKRQIEEVAPIVESVDYNDTLLKAYKGGAITLVDYISDRNYFTNAAIELVSLRYSAAQVQTLLQKYLNTSL